MTRLAWLLPLPLLAYLVALRAAEPASPPLPADTLPAQLVLDAVPLGLARDRPVPADNPLTAAKVQLGRRLFFDPVLSADRSVACASCHSPTHGLASPHPQAVGIRGRRGHRNAPSLFNRAYGTSFFWDGREATLEGQALKPIECAQEMGTTVADVVKRLQEHAEYKALFQAAFADGVTALNLARALASFERTLLLGNSKIDRFRIGEVAGLNAAERQGLWLFESRGRCWRCHAGPNLSDESFHNTGVSWGREPLDLGRYGVTKEDADRGKFKTPTLRGVAETPPYMHDGSIGTLEEVVEFYNRGGGKNPNLDPFMEPLGLSPEDVKNLAAFLKAMSAAPEGPKDKKPEAPKDKKREK
jgi:cytochrome c peroxidase